MILDGMQLQKQPVKIKRKRINKRFNNGNPELREVSAPSVSELIIVLKYRDLPKNSLQHMSVDLYKKHWWPLLIPQFEHLLSDH